MTRVLVLQDCTDKNAQARVSAAVGIYFDGIPAYIPLEGPAGLIEGSLDLLDMIDAARPLSGVEATGTTVILCNAAPRASSHGKYPNGTPFGYFWANSSTLVVSTYNPELLSLVRRMGITDHLQLMEVAEVMAWAAKQGLANTHEQEAVVNSQFRSLTFEPFAAWAILKYGEEVPSTHTPLEPSPAPTGKALRIDNFGNIWTDYLPADVAFKEGGTLKLANGEVAPCYRRLADVPPGELAVVIGSSGYAEKRFLMVTIQGGNAKARLGAHVGMPIIAA